MKVALVYDRINKFGGAERVLSSLHHLYPDAPIYTLVHEPRNSAWAKGINIIPTFLNKFSFLRSRHEWLAPLASLAFETHDLSKYDCVISVTSGDAKAVITRPNQLHICYCLTPTRYFWSGEKEYAQDHKIKLIPGFLIDYFRTVDLLTSMRPDEYLSISREVQKRVKKYYNRDSTIIYPSIEEKFYSKKPLSMDKRHYFLIVSRLVPYKKVDLAISVFGQLGLPLIVIGTGSEAGRLKHSAKSNIKFVGIVDDRRLIEYYRLAKAVIFPQCEDFGLVPLEAQACGTPVIAYGQGGALETVISGQTGLFFDDQSETSLVRALHEFETIAFNPEICRQNAKRFSFASFSRNFTTQVNRLYSKYLPS